MKSTKQAAVEGDAAAPPWDVSLQEVKQLITTLRDLFGQLLTLADLARKKQGDLQKMEQLLNITLQPEFQILTILICDLASRGPVDLSVYLFKVQCAGLLLLTDGHAIEEALRVVGVLRICVGGDGLFHVTRCGATAPSRPEAAALSRPETAALSRPEASAPSRRRRGGRDRRGRGSEDRGERRGGDRGGDRRSGEGRGERRVATPPVSILAARVPAAVPAAETARPRVADGKIPAMPMVKCQRVIADLRAAPPEDTYMAALIRGESAGESPRSEKSRVGSPAVVLAPIDEEPTKSPCVMPAAIEVPARKPTWAEQSEADDEAEAKKASPPAVQPWRPARQRH